MAVRSKEELLTIIKDRIGEDSSDEAISFIEDVTDTLNDYESRASEDWEVKYHQLDEEWRTRYKERFFNPEKEVEKEKEEEEEKKEVLTFNDLFEEVE